MVPLFWVSHRVFIVSQAPLINKKVQGERLFKCHHLDQSSWVTNQKQSFCFMVVLWGLVKTSVWTCELIFTLFWKCGWYFIQRTLDKAIFPYVYGPALRTQCQSVSFFLTNFVMFLTEMLKTQINFLIFVENFTTFWTSKNWNK